MRLNVLLLIAGLVALLFGLGFLLVPGPLLAGYGVTADPAAILMARFFGAALVQLGLVLYLTRDVADPAGQRGIVLGSFLGSAAGLMVALMGQISGLVGALGWSTVVIYFLFLLGFGSFLIAKPRGV
jgi:hypothetical protein